MTRKCSLRRQADFLCVRDPAISYNSVELDARRFSGALLRLALHWSANTIEQGGTVSFSNVEEKGYGFGKRAVRRWQIQSLFRSPALRDFEQVQQEPGRLCFRRKHKPIAADGVSVCIVSSNDQRELQKLLECVDAILTSATKSELPLEIVICLTDINAKVDAEVRKRTHGMCEVRFIQHDCGRDEQIYIAEKKAKLWDEARYALRVIMHTRILLQETFLEEIARLPIQVAAPQVHLEGGLPYLDFVYLKTLDSAGTSRSAPLLGSVLGSRYFFPLARGWTPYVDGGVCVFQRDKVGFNPYAAISDVPWGEAEDVSMARVLAARGIVIDYLHELSCTSSTSKFNYGHGAFRALRAFRQRARHLLHSNPIGIS
ncbi:hypothetical protein [Oricola sp.]|uniref:hypothetical protein n=1 Tax=Oricola sp. TaxID=1979950 RepID=UPI003BA9FEBC